ncbi:hypothetical protein PHYBOEH_003725 [Phytophthora boehmeriae]|uniref:Serine protease family S33 n=1 Tax=Phytophthora boehmeriae TaxID=109152 RepID=A0A8T1WN69_9STRA|nr:hypothetical protein PHYBOEH_003725 [Phytophthora boehmeriae]
MLISFSELWSDPSPTEAELEQFYEDGVFSVGPGKLETYCLLSGNLASASSSNRDRACASVGAELENAGVTTPLWNSTPIFTYQVDEYSNRTATVPPNSSVLMINGGFDFQTPWEFGRHQFESMALGDPDSSSKMMIEFEFGSHVCGLSPTTKDDDTLCGPSIVASFILESGDTEAVDTSCMANLPELELNDDAFAMVVESLVEAQREQKLNDGTEASG